MISSEKRAPMTARLSYTKSLLVVDLDNTLFDWLTFWNTSFGILVQEVIEHADISRDTLLTELKKIHQRVGTVEYSFVLQELRAVIEPKLDQRFEDFAEATISAYRRARTTALTVYPTVIATLREIKARGTRIVALTESSSFHTMYRLKKLGLDGVLDRVYSTPDHFIPQDVSLEILRSKSANDYLLSFTEQRRYENNMKKPHPMLLLNTIDAEHFSVEDAVYVGDSLGRDVFMAQQAGVLDVFAAYGAPTNYEQLSLLTRVTHWSEKEIIAQQRASECILPTIILHFAFGELLQHICFTNASEA